VCKECGGAGICAHGRQRYGCKDCGESSWKDPSEEQILSHEVDMRKDDFDGYVEGFGANMKRLYPMKGAFGFLQPKLVGII